jgi:DNA-binding NtrC family response regulator
MDAAACVTTCRFHAVNQIATFCPAKFAERLSRSGFRARRISRRRNPPSPPLRVTPSANPPYGAGKEAQALRLMVIGNLDGRFATAAQIAGDKGASVFHAEHMETALAMLRGGHGADLLMVDAAIDLRGLAARLRAARIAAPIVACGTQHDAGVAVAAIHAGAREYIPLPPDPEVIAAILAAVADDGQGLPPVSPPQPGQRREGVATARVAHAALAAETVTRGLVGRTVADVERDLILETLKRCLGNRTHAAGLLGISIRTLRNKLTVYAAEGVSVPPPNNGEMRGAA